MATASGGVIWLAKGWYPCLPSRFQCSLFILEGSTLGSHCVLHHGNHIAVLSVCLAEHIWHNFEAIHQTDTIVLTQFTTGETGGQRV